MQPPLRSTISINSAVHGAKDLPDLIDRLSAIDPDAAAQLKGKALLASKSLWGTGATMVVSWVVTKYGFGWPPELCAEISGLLVMAAVAVLRCLTNSPITGITTAAPASSSARTI